MTEGLNHYLADRMERLAMDLLGTAPTSRCRGEIRFGAKGSLAIQTAGPKRGAWFDFQAGVGGAPLGLIRHARKCSTREAVRWAQDWLGMTPGSQPPPKPTGRLPAAPEGSSWTADLARSMWQEAVLAEGTLAEAYIRWRGLTLEPCMPIRFHPRAWRNNANGPPGPAVLALMTCAETAEPVGLHVTYLRADGLGKAEGDRVKVMLGKAGVIRLAPIEGPTLGIAEGIETGLTVAQHFRWRPVWCATSAGGIGRFPVLAGIQTLMIFADRDPAGINAARTCAANWTRAGREARICLPPAGDFNDLVRGQAA
jgi:hypothetical protein